MEGMKQVGPGLEVVPSARWLVSDGRYKGP